MAGSVHGQPAEPGRLGADGIDRVGFDRTHRRLDRQQAIADVVEDVLGSTDLGFGLGPGQDQLLA